MNCVHCVHNFIGEQGKLYLLRNILFLLMISLNLCCSLLQVRSRRLSIPDHWPRCVPVHLLGKTWMPAANWCSYVMSLSFTNIYRGLEQLPQWHEWRERLYKISHFSCSSLLAKISNYSLDSCEWVLSWTEWSTTANITLLCAFILCGQRWRYACVQRLISSANQLNGNGSYNVIMCTTYICRWTH